MSYTILVTDDENNIVEMIRQAFLSQTLAGDYQIITAQHGQSALEHILSEEKIDLLLCDINMPIMDGLTLLKKIQDTNLSLATIILTAYGDMDKIRAAMQLGAYDFLEKPVSISRLTQSVQHALQYVEQTRERQQLQDQLEQSRKMESLGILTGGIAHDLNNVFQLLQGHIELCLLKTLPDDKRYTWLKHMENNTEHAGELLKKILLFSHQQSSKPVKTPLYPIIDNDLKMIRSGFPNSVTITQFLDEDICPVIISPTQVHQILLNLCRNALYAIGLEGEIIVTLKNCQITSQHVDTRSLSPGQYVYLSLQDNGCGMNETTQQQLFEPFFTTKPLGTGTGMGLSIIRDIMKTAGGMITVQSAPNQGTTFSLYFPVEDD